MSNTPITNAFRDYQLSNTYLYRDLTIKEDGVMGCDFSVGPKYGAIAYFQYEADAKLFLDVIKKMFEERDAIESETK